MKRKVRTLIVLTPGFPESEADVNCLPMQQLFVRTVREQFPQVRVVVLSFQYPYTSGYYKFFDIEVESFNGRNKGGIRSLLLRRRVYKALKELNRTTDIVGLLSFWYGECALVGSRFGKAYGVKHYCWIMGQDARAQNKLPGKLKLEGDELVALSDFLQVEFEKNHGVRPARVITPGVTEKLFTGNIKERNIDILGAGSFISLKQFSLFIDVVGEVKRRLPKVKAVIAGNGAEYDALKQRIEECGLEHNISLVGELPHHELLSRMGQAKIFLHPSSYEGFSGVCMEALAAGAHVVSFCRAMNKEIEQWHIVNSREGMTEKVLDLMQANLTYENVLEYRMEDTVKKMMELFVVPETNRGGAKLYLQQ